MRISQITSLFQVLRVTCYRQPSSSTRNIYIYIYIYITPIPSPKFHLRNSISRHFLHTVTSELLRPTILLRMYTQTPKDKDVSCSRVMHWVFLQLSLKRDRLRPSRYVECFSTAFRNVPVSSVIYFRLSVRHIFQLRERLWWHLHDYTCIKLSRVL